MAGFGVGLPVGLLMILLMAEILHQLRLVVYPIIYRVSYIPGGARFQPSTVVAKMGGVGGRFFFQLLLGDRKFGIDFVMLYHDHIQIFAFDVDVLHFSEGPL